jgi:hypothetical protein
MVMVRVMVRVMVTARQEEHGKGDSEIVTD